MISSNKEGRQYDYNRSCSYLIYAGYITGNNVTTSHIANITEICRKQIVCTVVLQASSWYHVIN